MSGWCLLIRGINVGGKNRIPMAKLRDSLTSAGLSNVTSVIQTGNLCFTSDLPKPELVALATAVIADEFGFRPALILLTTAELDELMGENPFPDATEDPSRLHAWIFGDRPAAPDLEAVEKLRARSERWSLAERAFWLHAPDGIGRSKLAAVVEQKLGVKATARNWRTLGKLRQAVRSVD